MTTFLVLLNFTLWLVDTFELQKSRASRAEAEFFGPLTWVWLQRLTLPLVIFFRSITSMVGKQPWHLAMVLNLHCFSQVT